MSEPVPGISAAPSEDNLVSGRVEGRGRSVQRLAQFPQPPLLPDRAPLASLGAWQTVRSSG